MGNPFTERHLPEGLITIESDRVWSESLSPHVMALVPPMKHCVRPPANMGIKEDVDLRVWAQRIYTDRHDSNLKELIGQVLWEDVSTMRRCQLGMQSSGFEAVSFFEQENRNIHQFAELDRYLRPDTISQQHDR